MTRFFEGAMMALLLTSVVGCHRVEVRARCTVRTAGSYCTFQNTGQQPGRACFRIAVHARVGVAPYVATSVCSPALQPGEESAPEAIGFGGADPFERCTIDPATGQPTDCQTIVT